MTGSGVWPGAGGARIGRHQNKGVARAEQACERQEREAVRGPEGQGDVEGAGREDRELAGRVEPRRQEVGLRWQLLPGRDDRAEEGRGPQGWQGRGAEVVASAAVERRGRDLNPRG